MTNKHYLQIEDIDYNSNLATDPLRFWKGEYQSYVLLKKLHKPIYREKRKWIVLSAQGNLYIFDTPTSREPNDLFITSKLTLTHMGDYVGLFSKEYQLRFLFENPHKKDDFVETVRKVSKLSDLIQ